MKTIKYTVSVAILMISIATFAQSPEINIDSSQQFSNVKDFKCDPTEMLGPWIARDGDMTYELSFIIDTVSKSQLSRVISTPSTNIGMKYRRLVGTMVYKRNGTVMRMVSPQSHPKYMSILGSMGDLFYMAIYFYDYERDVFGQAALKLVEGNHNRATWQLLKTSGDGTFDIPQEMTFTRVWTSSGSIDSSVGGFERGEP